MICFYLNMIVLHGKIIIKVRGEGMKRVIALFIILCLVSGCSSKGSDSVLSNYHTISSEEVFKEIEMETSEDFYIIDVRTPAEYAYQHIPTAINIPLNTIDSIDSHQFKKDAKIVVYCQSGARSKQAAERLLEIGYQRVFDLGGLQDWNYEIVQ